jgi:hypothetical protein
MQLSVFCGVSVDGFIARPNHALDFLDAGGDEPHGRVPDPKIALFAILGWGFD